MAIPRYASLAVRVARELREQLKNDFLSGGKLPSEPEIATQLGVSRGTVRQALTILEREGVISRRQGSGTFANQQVLQIQARADLAYEFSEMLRLAGYEASIQPIAIEKVPLDKKAAEFLNLEPGSPALSARKLFLADGKPAIYCIDLIPLNLVCDNFEEIELHRPVFEFLKAHCGHSIQMNLTELIPEVARGDVARWLELEAGEPLLRFDEVGQSETGLAVLFSRIYFRDSLIRFSILRKKV